MNESTTASSRSLWSLSSAMPRPITPRLSGPLARWSERLLRRRLRQQPHGAVTQIDLNADCAEIDP